MSQPIPDPRSQIQDNLVKDTTVGGDFTFAPQQIATYIETQIIEISAEKVTQQALIKASPYKGLKRFNFGDREYFFGRDALIAKLFKAVNKSSFSLVLGASGSGKSSVVRAGLIPELKKSLESQKFYDFIFTPNQDPFESLYRCLLSEEKDYRFSESAAKVALKARPDTLLQVISDLKKDEERWFFFIDQFEQLFTICTDLEKRKNFIEGIVQVARKGEGSVRIVLAMRSDFLEQFSFYPTLGAIANQNNIHLVTEMYPDELRQAIEQPAAKHGVVFEKGLVEQIIKEVEGQSGYLPLLQYTLNLLWERECENLGSDGRSHIEDRILNKKSYADLNGVRGALQKRVNEIYKDICEKNKDGEAVTKQIFLNLVNIVDSDSGSRAVSRRAYRYEFVGKVIENTLNKFVDENLLVSSYEYLNEEEPLVGESIKHIEHATIEIAHEILLSSWDKLKHWLVEEKEAIILKNWLAGETRRWLEVRAKDKSTANDELLKGSRLEQVVEFREKNAFEKLGGLVQQENDFIDASVEWRNRLLKEKEERRKRQLIAVSITSVVLAGFSIFAAFQWRQAEIQKIRALRESSESLLISNQHLDALLNSLQAAKSLNHPLFKVFTPNDLRTEVTKSLRRVFYQVKERNRVKKLVGQLISITPDGEPMVAESIKEPIKYLLDSQGNQVIPFEGFQASLNPVNYSPGIIYSPDGRFIAIADIHDAPWHKSEYGTVSLWDSQTNKLTQFTRHQGGVKSISFSPDSKKIATVDGNSTVRLWDIESKEKIKESKNYSSKNIVGIGFTPNNQVLVATADKTADKNVLNLWSLESQDKLHELYGYTDINEFSRVIFSSNGKRIVIEYGTKPKYYTDEERDVSIFLWNYLEDKPFSLTDLESLPLTDDIFTSMSHDGKQLATALNNSNVRFWDLEDKDLKWSKISQQARSVSISADGKKLATANQDGTVGIWDLKSEKFTPISAIHNSIRKVSLSADGKKLATADQDGTVGIWDLESEKFFPLPEKFPSGDSRGDYQEIEKIKFSPDSGKLAVILRASLTRSPLILSRVSLWNLETKQMQFVKDTSGFPMFSSEGQLQFLSADGLGQNETQLLDLNHNQVLQFKLGTPCPIAIFFDTGGSISISDKGGLIASAGGDRVCLWDLEGNYLTGFKIPQGNMKDISFNSDGSLIAIAVDNGSILLWKVGGLDELMVWGCDWIQGYLDNPNTNLSEEERSVCNGV